MLVENKLGVYPFCLFAVFQFYYLINILEQNLNKLFNSDVEIPFSSNRFAEIAYHTLIIDFEPKRSGVIKELELQETVLKV